MKTRNDLESRLQDLEVFLADDGLPKRTRTGYQLEAGRLRKAIAQRDSIIRKLEAGQSDFYGADRVIALVEAEDRATAPGLSPSQQSLWAGVAFAVMQAA